ncbi:MAG: hypothetical protein HPY55_07215 [Firmicutes bacterium]|nr:hypothetical protein [Bacillota bacterium]
MHRLETIAAETAYASIPWVKVALTQDERGERWIRCIEDNLRGMFNPTETDPRFWRTVRQLYFAFEKNDWRQIEDFYGKYGHLLPHGPCLGWGRNETMPGVNPCKPVSESWGVCMKWLDWFRGLTLMVEWVKNGKVGPLWDLFRQGRNNAGDRPFEKAMVIKEELSAVYLVGDGSWPYVRYLPWPPIFRKKTGRGGTAAYETIWMGPQNDDQLLRDTWEAIVDCVSRVLPVFVLIPMLSREDDPRFPLYTWVFGASGAILAAFLQWFFQELGYLNVTRCSAADCGNLVLPPREKFCSERCRQREKKRRQRQGRRTPVGVIRTKAAPSKTSQPEQDSDQ